MTKPPINPDAHTLEDAFFARENTKLLEEMRRKAELKERRDALRTALPNADDAALDHLLEMGINAQTVLAMMLLPLARVAWADGAMEPKEKAAILRAAAERGVVSGSAPYDLLQSWLDHQPGPSIVAAWQRYIDAIWPRLTPDEQEQFRARLLGLARGVAEAAGGFLGLGAKISAAEEGVLAEIEAALQ